MCWVLRVGFHVARGASSDAVGLVITVGAIVLIVLVIIGVLLDVLALSLVSSASLPCLLFSKARNWDLNGLLNPGCLLELRER